MSEPKISVVRIESGEWYETRSYSWNTPGTHDYKSEGFEVDRIIDRNGVEHVPHWAEEPTELFPGCVTSREGGYRYTRVSSSACPVKILESHWYRYTGSEAGHDSSWTSRTWYHLEAAEEAE
jgi:hypothetical protein